MHAQNRYLDICTYLQNGTRTQGILHKKHTHTTAKPRTLRDITNLLWLGVEADCFRGKCEMCYNLPLYERERKRGGRNKQRSGGMTLEEKYGVKGREEGKKYRSLEWGKLRP